MKIKGKFLYFDNIMIKNILKYLLRIFLIVINFHAAKVSFNSFFFIKRILKLDK